MDEKSKQTITFLKNLKGSAVTPFVFRLKKLHLKASMDISLTGLAVNENGALIFTNEKRADGAIKLYTSTIYLFLELSRAAISLLLHLGKVMNNQNAAAFDYSKDYKKLRFETSATAISSLQELIEKDAIYPHSTKNIWWVNRIVISKGKDFAPHIEIID